MRFLINKEQTFHRIIPKAYSQSSDFNNFAIPETKNPCILSCLQPIKRCSLRKSFSKNILIQYKMIESVHLGSCLNTRVLVNSSPSPLHKEYSDELRTKSKQAGLMTSYGRKKLATDLDNLALEYVRYSSYLDKSYKNNVDRRATHRAYEFQSAAKINNLH